MKDPQKKWRPSVVLLRCKERLDYILTLLIEIVEIKTERIECYYLLQPAKNKKTDLLKTTWKNREALHNDDKFSCENYNMWP